MTKEGYAEGKEPSQSLQDARITSSKRSKQGKRSSHSSSSRKENHEPDPDSNKWRRSVADTDDVVSKSVGKDSEVPNGLQEARQDLHDDLLNSCQTNRYRSNLPYTLIRLMYQLDLSVLCSLRKMRYKHKYPTLSLAFEDSEIDTFNDIVFRHEGKSIHVRIETVDKYYTNNDISYGELFTKENEKESFSINNYFDGFVKSLISKLDDSSSSNIEYLIVYTNSGLNLTEEKKLKDDRSRNFYPFKFDSVNMEECEILKDFLFKNDNGQEHGFYQFSRDKTIRRELLTRLGFTPAMWKAVKKRNNSEEFQKQIKRAFLKKLVFAVNQPSREELNSIIRNEMKENSGGRVNYITLRERILSNLATPGKHKKLGNYVTRITYEFNLLLLFLHDMFLDKNMFSINFEGKRHAISHSITINYRDKITYVKAHNAESDIGYSELFPPGQQGEKDRFSINKHFALFVEGSESDTKHFIIYTNADLNLTEEKRFKKKGKSRDFYPLKFDSLDIQKKRYKGLRNCSCINENSLYRFAKEEATGEKVLGQLKLPPFLRKEIEGGRSDENEKEIEVKFLGSLIFAVKQYDKEELNSVIRNEVGKADVPYNHEELREIALRWLESHEFGHITKEIMKKLLEDIKNNRSSYQKIQNGDINEEMKFAKSVVGRQGTPTFYQFLDFLIKGEGKRYLGVLKSQRIDLINMSSILYKSENDAVQAFKALYDLWFDEKGNKTEYLKTLEKVEVNLTSMCCILNGAGNNAVEAFKGLFDLWFDEKRNETQYLKTLEEEGIKLANMSSILNGAENNAVNAFKRLYDLWFDEEGNKTKYLKTLEKEGMKLVSMSGILNGAGNNAVEAFKGLFDLWFDEKGNKTRYLKTLEKKGINLAIMSGILNGAGNNAVKAFKGLYNTFFDEKGNIKQHLKHFIEEKERNSFTLQNLSSILYGAGGNPQHAFEELHSVCFNDDGKRTKLLDDFYKADLKASHLSSILWGSGVHAAYALKRLHSVWLNNEGKRTKLVDDFYAIGFTSRDLCHILSGAAGNLEMFHGFCFVGETKKYLNHFLNEKKGFTPSNLCSILHRARANICSAFRDFCNICFDETGNKTQILDDFYKAGFTPNNLSRILSMTGNNAAFILRNFHESCYDKRNYLNHFLAEEELFTPTDLCKILRGAGINTCANFEKLHDFCFDEAGNKTEYLNKLIENDQGKICDILYEEVRKLHFVR